MANVLSTADLEGEMASLISSEYTSDPYAHVPQLPIELVDIIFSALDASNAEDKNSLSACAAVCRAWVDLARFHLFRHVQFHVVEGHSDAISNQKNTTLETLYRFFSEHPEISCLVRRLRISAVLPTKPSKRLLDPAVSYYDPPVLLSFLGLFARLDDLFLDDIFVASPADAQPNLPLPSLSNLEIRSNQEEIPPSDLTLLLGCFAAVGRVNIDTFCVYNFERQSVEYDGPKYLQVCELQQRRSHSTMIYTGLASSPSAQSLRVMTLSGLEFHVLRDLQTLLHATHANLERLNISLVSLWDDALVNGPPLLDFSCCEALHSVEIGMYAQLKDWIAVWNVVQTVSSKSNQKLEQIKLVVRTSEPVPSDWWKALDRRVLSKTSSALAHLSTHRQYRQFMLATRHDEAVENILAELLEPRSLY